MTLRQLALEPHTLARIAKRHQRVCRVHKLEAKPVSELSDTLWCLGGGGRGHAVTQWLVLDTEDRLLLSDCDLVEGETKVMRKKLDEEEGPSADGGKKTGTIDRRKYTNKDAEKLFVKLMHITPRIGGDHPFRVTWSIEDKAGKKYQGIVETCADLETGRARFAAHIKATEAQGWTPLALVGRGTPLRPIPSVNKSERKAR
jgi:hypothetical protein